MGVTPRQVTHIRVSKKKTEVVELWIPYGVLGQVDLYKILKAWSTATPPVETTKDYAHNHFECPLRLTLNDVLRVYLIWVSLDCLLYLAKPSTTIDHSAPVEKWHLELNLWPWPWTLTSKQVETTKCHVKTRFITVWSWPLTYNLDLQSQPSQGQPSCKKSRS